MSFSISKWVCPPPETFDPPKGSDGRVEWFRCLPYIAIHIAAIFAFFYPVTIACIVLAVVSYSIRMFTITAFFITGIFHIELLKHLELYNFRCIHSM